MKKIVIILAMFLSIPLNAATIKAVIKGGQLYWQNAVMLSNDYLVPSYWTPVEHLAPTKTWWPGSITTSDNSIQLNNSNTSISLDKSLLQLVGLQYHIGSTNQTATPTQFANTQNCGNGVDFSLPIISISSSTINCSAASGLNITARQTPFAFVRPIFKVNNGGIVSLFKQENNKTSYPAGRYRSVSLPYNYFYDYLYDPSNVRTRHHLSSSYSVEIDYQAAEILRVDVVNGNVQTMNIMYHLNGEIEGNAKFEFKITGTLPNGYKMTFINNTRDYALNLNNVKIPYQMKWRSPSQNIPIIEDGKFKEITGHNGNNPILDSSCILPNKGKNYCRERYLDVNFKLDKQAAESIITGTYTDTFTVMIEANL